MVVDIRTVPRSRHNPQYNIESLPESLSKAGIGYMQTEEFEKNLQELIRISSSAQIALMCAEAVQWRCHRSLIADALLVRGIRVEHIPEDKRKAT